MELIRVTGGAPICGVMKVDTAKNAALPIMAASILPDSPCMIERCPRIADVHHMSDILRLLGCDTRWEQDTLCVDATRMTSWEMPDDLSKQLRSSIFMLGPLLARHRCARVTYPGGCEIGLRPINLHLHVLRTLGVTVREDGGYIRCDGENMHAADIHLDYPSVGATENAMMASVYLDGVTSISNAAREPEIVDLAGFINAMGGHVRGAGSNRVEITGIKRLRGIHYAPMADRIAAGTFMAAAAITGGELELEGAPLADMVAITSKLREMGCSVRGSERGAVLTSPKRLRAFASLQTQPHPGFPTDMQVQMLALATVAQGTSVIVENVFENRFSHAGDLMSMGADIRVSGQTAIVQGVRRLRGMRVRARDLRGGASLLLAGLCAEGETLIEQPYVIDRGYASIERTLASLGAHVRRVQE